MFCYIELFIESHITSVTRVSIGVAFGQVVDRDVKNDETGTWGTDTMKFQECSSPGSMREYLPTAKTP